MPDITLQNEQLTVGISLHGAELRSIKNTAGREYLWQADPAFWARTSPVLFPFVGAVNEKVFRVNGRAYPMGQHGFARDMDFALVENTDTEAWFSLTSTPDTLEKYPFPFILLIGYTLDGSSVTVKWRVANPGQEELPFSIGAHPAFNCPFAKEEGWALALRDVNGLPLERFERKPLGGGLVCQGAIAVEAPGGKLPLTPTTFDIDTFILENGQADSVALVAPDGSEPVRVDFSAPLVGLWSPPGKNAPFVCIEPWYGRSDEVGFAGELKERAWGNLLAPGGEFETEYTITLS